jgi:hypothetical protein
MRMTIQLSLFADGKEIGCISTAIWMKHENALLEEVFPEQDYWNKTLPRPFDFVANEGEVKNAILRYLRRTKENPKGTVYVAPSIERRSEAHLASPKEVGELANSFATEIQRLYDTGLRLQKEGKRLGIIITS